MKKIVLLLLTVCMCFSVSAMLAACNEEHTHTYEKKWSSNDDYHWHACEGEGCKATAEKGAHDWKESAEDPDALVCTVCGKIGQNDQVPPSDTLTEAEWRAALSEAAFTVDGYLNVSVKYSDASGEEICYIAGGKHKEGNYVSENFTFEELLRKDCGSAFEMASYYSMFEYNAQTDSYVLYDASVDDEMYELVFENKKLVSCTITVGVGTEDEESWTHTYFDVGTTVIPDTAE